LLWQKRDAGLLGFFANQILDAAERERAWQRYYKIRDFAELDKCRHRQICLHFGETPKWSSCSACDVCGEMPDWLSLVAAPKKGRKAVRSLAAQARAQETSSAAGNDSDLREYLREWRRMMAKEQGLPAYTVLHDTTLDEICRIRPSSIAQLRTITGIGERKAESIGLLILRALEEYRTGARAAQLQASTPPMQETLELLNNGKTFEEIAAIRGRQISTVMSTVAALVETGELEFSPAWLSPEKVSVIEAACTRLQTDGYQRLKPLKEILPPDITYSEIRLVVARLRRQSSQNSPQPTT
jgi:ATP-dependent DNA helicase RecQ